MSAHLSFNALACHGCQACMLACALSNEGRAALSQARLRVVLDVFTGRQDMRLCRQCVTAPCAQSCVHGAITRKKPDGPWAIDEDLCVGCGVCVDACPFKAIFWRADVARPIMCDLCGGSPECAASCLGGALTFVDAQWENDQ